MANAIEILAKILDEDDIKYQRMANEDITIQTENCRLSVSKNYQHRGYTVEGACNAQGLIKREIAILNDIESFGITKNTGEIYIRGEPKHEHRRIGFFLKTDKMYPRKLITFIECDDNICTRTDK